MPLRNRRLEMGKKPIKGLANAVDSQDAVPKAQMDTAISTATAAITTTSLGAVPTSRTISAGTGLSGGGDLSANRTISLADTAVTPGSYTNASITVDQQGRLTSASTGSTTYTETFKTSSDQTVSSSTTFINATNMNFSISANTLTYFEFRMFINGGGGGAKLAIDGPALTSLRVAEITGVIQTAYDTTVSSTTSSNERLVELSGLIECSASGTVHLRFAQTVSNISGAILRKGGRVRSRTVS